MVELRAKIIELLKGINKDVSLQTIDNETDLFKTGYFDSLTVVQFIVALEKKFQIKISKNDINYETFTTIEKIENLLKEKLK